MRELWDILKSVLVGAIIYVCWALPLGLVLKYVLQVDNHKAWIILCLLAHYCYYAGLKFRKEQTKYDKYGNYIGEEEEQ